MAKPAYTKYSNYRLKERALEDAAILRKKRKEYNVNAKVLPNTTELNKRLYPWSVWTQKRTVKSSKKRRFPWRLFTKQS